MRRVASPVVASRAADTHVGRTRCCSIAVQFQQLLDALAAGRLKLKEHRLRHGKQALRGERRLADDTYAELLDGLSERKFAGVSRCAARRHHAQLTALVPWKRDDSPNSLAGHPGWPRCSSLTYAQ